MDPAQQACLKRLLEYFPKIESDLEQYGDQIMRFVKQMSAGSLQILKWKLPFGKTVYDYVGVLVQLTNDEGQSFTELFTSDQVFAYYGEEQARSVGSSYYSAMKVDPSSDIITEPEASPVNLTAEGFLRFTKIRFFASAIKEVIPKLNSLLQNSLNKAMFKLIETLGGEPGAILEEAAVDNPKDPHHLGALFRGVNDAVWAKLDEAVAMVKIRMKQYFERLSEWFSRNKGTCAAFAFGGTVALLAAQKVKEIATKAGRTKLARTALVGVAKPGMAGLAKMSSMALAYPVTFMIATFLVGGTLAVAITGTFKKSKLLSAEEEGGEEL
uniref:Transmembrane protein n=1 Tax=Palpitomonas bilix TaxID=652834 RepID=A0A7S3GBV1_9EUKA|mmetsp:Transcript_41310/g.106920  ORF Transcript_41310/g.106920 Transcript_41310/m.106920 type:complete len:326 (+) Transcript_41310:314-1291(+)|eukprot:CAMPEP_0113889072 /NCGR_PEP_ID=MMETSP0780_2-20120614/13264_1 /TAXON_ID=652834 /ORGANISM="Palpitomonas bilix" /LENGTH=325 /DNA_ID=CAMNT_0000878071 /DNA_START=318 /DNA_END=1295 /DNA_ORIENTATION=- /assembly_acc=CAM_ASM_000599